MMLWASSSPEGPWLSLPSTVTRGYGGTVCGLDACRGHGQCARHYDASWELRRTQELSLEEGVWDNFYFKFLSPLLSFSDLQQNSALCIMCLDPSPVQGNADPSIVSLIFIVRYFCGEFSQLMNQGIVSLLLTCFVPHSPHFSLFLISFPFGNSFCD